MILKIQIISLIFSFFYGIFFYILLEVNSHFLYSTKLPFKIINSFLFVMLNTLLYFIILKKINNGIVHVYFLLCITVGYIIAKIVRAKLFVKRK